MAVDILQLQGIAIELGEAAARACAQRDTLNEIAQTWASIATEHASELSAKDGEIERLREALRFLLIDAYDGNLDAQTYDRLAKLMRGA